jgi:hypothetical protein
VRLEKQLWYQLSKSGLDRDSLTEIGHYNLILPYPMFNNKLLSDLLLSRKKDTTALKVRGLSDGMLSSKLKPYA